jgi:5'-nucleotidase
MTFRLPSPAIAACIVAATVLGAAASSERATITLSVVGTTDLHGYVFPRNGNGGLALLGGYLRNLRAARAEDGGGVVLLDSGDTYQGGMESNLSEGAIVVDAYNELGYTAGAIGNHDFDFGAVDTPRGRQTHGDPRGALKALALRARYPMLTANLVDEATGQRVDWPHVPPSALAEVAGINVGIVGVMTTAAMRATLPSNVRGLRVAPLAPAIIEEATRLRSAGAQVVVVAAHAGGSCSQFENPSDLSSCDESTEIFSVAREIPPGLVNVIAAGHTHEGVGHIVNGIAIVQSYFQGRAFGRADLVIDRESGRVADVHVYAPREVCARQAADSRGCDPGDSAPISRYEGRDVMPDAAVERAMAPQLERVRALQAMGLGVDLDTPLPRATAPESALGNLFADALREQAGADVAVNNNGAGGIRSDLPAGPLTFGKLYEVFPFDNRLARIRMSAEELSRALASALRRPRRAGFGVSGMLVRVRCGDNGLKVDLLNPSGEPLEPNQQLTVVAMDSMVSGSNFGVFAPSTSYALLEDGPTLRETVEDWLVHRGGHMSAGQFIDVEHPRWEAPDPIPASCLK